MFGCVTLTLAGICSLIYKTICSLEMSQVIFRKTLILKWSLGKKILLVNLRKPFNFLLDAKGICVSFVFVS